jgi:hypothetical protein
MNKLNRGKERLSGAFGRTEVSFDPQTRRSMTMDVKNCPHCGVHHASLPVIIQGDRLTVECPDLRRSLHMTLKLFLHPIT